MRKERFVKKLAGYIPYLRNIAMKTGLDYDTAGEIASQCSFRLLDSKKYLSVDPTKLKAFLHAALRFEVQHHIRDEIQKNVDCARLPDPELSFTADSKVSVANLTVLEPELEQECPFCFRNNLNEYGACNMCHTIIPSYRRVQRNVITMTEESLAVEFDFNTKIDIENAIARLTPFEQRVVKAVGLGNESLESFALDIQVSKTSLVRVWVEAKAKLQESLREYGPEYLSKRGSNAFRKAVQSIEITQ